MKILLTGCDGFMANELISGLEGKYLLYKTNRRTLDVLDSTAVDKFFDENEVDCVIHTATSGGRRTCVESPSIFYNNIKMFENLAKHRAKYKLMFSFGSGAEKNRKVDIMQMAEERFLEEDSPPSDFYGFSKYMISQRINAINDNIFNFRIFNLFGASEENDRMIKNNIIKNMSHLPFEIHQDRVMDFFSSHDLCLVLEYYMQNISKIFLYKDLNLCYTNKVKLSDVCKEIQKSGKKAWTTFDESGFAPAYCGSSQRIDSLGIEFLGLSKSIAQMYEFLRRKEW